MDARARLSSRKFLLVLLAVSMAFVLALLELLTSEFSMVVSLCIPAYLGINGYVEGRRITTQNGGEHG